MSDYIKVSDVSRKFFQNGKQLNVLDDISFDVKKSEFICIVGSSGCGKSTLLRILSGLDSHHGGEVDIDGKKIEKPAKERGFVFQEARLFPWLSVKDNIIFALDEGTKKEKEERALAAIKLVGLTGFENAYPKELSGGMAQRTNIARALVNNPSVLFLDEPFGALDAFTKICLQNELLRIKEEENTTMIMVTHDIEEAVYLSDRIIVLGKNPGRIRDIVEVDLPRPRDRNNVFFTETKKKVYDYFFEPVEAVEDYVI